MSHLDLINTLFGFPAPVAILFCDEIELKGNVVVDGFNSFCGDYLSAPTSVLIAYVKEAEIKGNARVYGNVVKGDAATYQDKTLIIPSPKQNLTTIILIFHQNL